MATMAKNKKRRFKKKHLFVILMLAYPVTHFLVMWIFVNFDSVLLSFRRFDIYEGEYKWVGLENYEILIDSLKINPSDMKRITNSISYLFVNVFVITPLCLWIAYVIYKQIVGGKAFRIVYFLPSIMPMIALVLAFKMQLDTEYGLISNGLKAMGMDVPNFFGEKHAQTMIWVFCVWAGIGYGVILFNSAMGRIPKEIIEYGKLEGIGYVREFFQVILPLIWPTFTTLLVFGLMAPFGVYMQPLFLTNGAFDTSTISLEIFFITRDQGSLETAAALGLFCSAIGAPVVLFIRKMLEKCYKDVDF